MLSERARRCSRLPALLKIRRISVDSGLYLPGCCLQPLFPLCHNSGKVDSFAMDVSADGHNFLKTIVHMEIWMACLRNSLRNRW